MNVSHSDALVFFGATGDLAYKKIFPSLQAMIKRGISMCRSSAWPRPHGTSMDPEEKMIGQQVGDATLFAREDYVQEAWRIVDPVLKAGTPVYEYEPGTWGTE